MSDNSIEIQNRLNVAVNKYYNTLNAIRYYATHFKLHDPSFQKKIDDINATFATSTTAAFETVSHILKLLHDTEIATQNTPAVPTVKKIQLRIPYWIQRNDADLGTELIVDAEIDLHHINSLDIRPNQHGIVSYTVPRCKNSLLAKKHTSVPSGAIIVNDVPLNTELFREMCRRSLYIIPTEQYTHTDTEFQFYLGIYGGREDTFIVSHRLYPRPDFPKRSMTILEPRQTTEGVLRFRLPRGLFDYIQPIVTEGTFHATT